MLLLAGCGGGGGGSSSSASVTGLVLNVDSGAAPNPQSTVQNGSNTTLSSSVDGSFSLPVATGATSLIVDSHSTQGVFNFTIPPVSGTEDVGDLWIGNTTVTVTGRVLDASTQSPIPNVTVSYAGRYATTDANGIFQLLNVAYPSTTDFAAFYGIVGTITATGYFPNQFNTSPNTSVAGVLTVSDILMTPLSDPNPPTPPYTIWGKITPTTLGANATVTLSQAGTVVRSTNADSTGTYYFWIGPGSYTLNFTSGTHTATSSVTVPATNSVERVDVQLP